MPLRKKMRVTKYHSYPPSPSNLFLFLSRNYYSICIGLVTPKFNNLVGIVQPHPSPTLTSPVNLFNPSLKSVHARYPKYPIIIRTLNLTDEQSLCENSFGRLPEIWRLEVN